MSATSASAVMFDLFGTLVPLPTARMRDARRCQLAEHLGCDRGAFLAAYTATKQARLTGRLGPAAEMLAAVAHLAGGAPDGRMVATAARALLAWTRADLELSTAHDALLGRLRSAGLRLGLVSDCEVEVAQLLPELPLARHFDAVTLSCLTGVRKPAPGQYEHCAGQLGVPVSRCLFVGDGGSDELGGAERAGATAIHLCVGELNPSTAPGSWPGRGADSLASLFTTITSVRWEPTGGTTN
jgi:putative hydrolase of the HAD superfamily